MAMFSGWSSWALPKPAAEGTEAGNEVQDAGAASTVDSVFNASKAWLESSAAQLQKLAVPPKPATPQAEGEGADKPEGADAEAKPADALAEKAAEVTKGLWTGLNTFANTIKTKVETVKDDWETEQLKFASQKKHLPSQGSGVAPWIGMADEDLIKSQVLALSSDSRNFLVEPPPGAHFAFDYDSYASTAIATMAADPGLEKMRYELVPRKVSEEHFWRNYFYRVSLIKQQSTLLTMTSEQQAASTAAAQSSKEPSLANPVSQSSRDAIAADPPPPKPRRIRDGLAHEDSDFASEEHQQQPTPATQAQAPTAKQTPSATSAASAASTTAKPAGDLIDFGAADESISGEEDADVDLADLGDLGELDKELDDLDINLDDVEWEGEDIDDMLSV